MYRIAIVEDSKSDADLLKECVNKYAEANNLQVNMTEFASGLQFLESDDLSYDIIFMDVKMPLLNGIKTAKRLREVNNSSCLVFVTSMANYAIYGYEVDATDYILKPITYEVFSYKMKKVLAVAAKRQNMGVSVKVKGGVIMQPVNDILYLELIDHRVVYHTLGGDVESWDTLANAFKALEEYGFAYCNSGYIVNLKHVVSVINNSVGLSGGVTLPISRSKKATFMQKLTLTMGG